MTFINLHESVDATLEPETVMESFVPGNEPRKFLYLTGLFLQGDTPNGNGRVYPASEIARAVEDLKMDISKRGPVPGELDHPDGMEINFDRLAVGITDIWMDGANGCGKMRVVPSPMGQFIEDAVAAGIKVGVSSRGRGDVDPRGYVRNFKIVTIDAVLSPSAPDAFPTASLAESLQRYKSGPETMKLYEMAGMDARAGFHLEKSLTELFTQLRDDVVWRKT